MKIFSVFVLFLTCLVPARADTQTWNITATCNPDAMFPPQFICNYPSNINAVFTTQLETGTFHEFEFGNTFTSANVVIGISGTFNGLAMTLVPNPPGDWLHADLPEEVLFMAGGVQYNLFPDFDQVWLIQPSGATEPLIWSAVDVTSPVPEPATILLLTLPLLLGLSKWAQMSLRRLSDR